MLRGRTAALFATTLTMALLSGSVAAAAADSPDSAGDIAGGGSGVVAPATERTTATAPDVDGGSGLEAALSGQAAAALDLFNQYRLANGLAPLREDAALTGLAQSWATSMAASGNFVANPDLVLPGYPVFDSEYIEDGVWGNMDPTAASLVDYAKTNYPESILQANVNHVGIGWSITGSGTAVLYWLSVEYQFNDIGPADAFYEEVDFLYDAGITTGYPDGGFHPSGTVSREAMAAFLYRFLTGQPEVPLCSADTARLFTDVGAGHPFCGAIEWLATTKITTGYPDGTFHPGENVSREAMAAFLYRAFVAPTIPACTSVRFSDVGTGHPFCGAIDWLAVAGVTTGWPDGTFRPGISVERQAMAAFLSRLAAL